MSQSQLHTQTTPPRSPKSWWYYWRHDMYDELKSQKIGRNRAERLEILMKMWDEEISDYIKNQYLRKALDSHEEWERQTAAYTEYQKSLLSKSQWSNKHNCVVIELE